MDDPNQIEWQSFFQQYFPIHNILLQSKLIENFLKTKHPKSSTSKPCQWQQKPKFLSLPPWSTQIKQNAIKISHNYFPPFTYFTRIRINGQKTSMKTNYVGKWRIFLHIIQQSSPYPQSKIMIVTINTNYK